MPDYYLLQMQQERPFQEVCSYRCAIKYSKQKEIKAINKRARNKLKDNPGVYLKENKKYLQKEINTIVKLIDKGVHCIDCDKTESWQWDAGHVRSRGAHSSLTYHLDNIFIQNDWCNTRGKVNLPQFLEGIEKMYGKEYSEKVDQLALKHPRLGMIPEDYHQVIKEARKIVRELKAADMEYPPKMRIKLRKEYNKKLNIYN